MQTMKLFTVLLLLTLTAFAPAHGAPEVGGSGTATSDEATSEQEKADIEDLVSRLEDPASRQQILADLRALQASQTQGDEGSSLALSEALELDGRVKRFITEYVSIVDGSELDATTIGKIGIMVAVTFSILLLVLINNWLSRLLDRRLSHRRAKWHLDTHRFSSLFAWQRWAGATLGMAALVYSTIAVTLEDASPASSYPLLSSLMETVLAVFLVVLLFLLIWESINAGMETLAERQDKLQNRRAQTLIPVMRNIIMFFLILLSSLVILSELGIDIVPLLAGAGVVGIAIGFGAQTLVKDFLTGFIIIIEDLLQIGDIVTVGDRTGSVRKITLRKIDLRALDGTVHTVPFSAIDIVDNLTKDYSYYMFDVGVAYRENTDEVVECLIIIDEELRQSDEFGADILEPLEVLGVDQFGDNAVVIKARTKTSAREQWRIGREFNRRIKQEFDKRDIEIPFPHQTLYFGQDKQGQAPAARVQLEESETSNGDE
tara:strand:+ start:69394 stop:70857 length:1464 start_codon:yes stop_codon:yes gene_type:complete